MHIFKKLSLIAFFASMMTALQGCSMKDAATAALILIAFMLPGCPVQEELDAIGAVTLNEVLAALVLGQETRLISNTGDEIFDIPAGTVTVHIFCFRVSDPTRDAARILVVDNFTNGSLVQDTFYYHDISTGSFPATDMQVRLEGRTQANTCTVTFRAV